MAFMQKMFQSHMNEDLSHLASFQRVKKYADSDGKHDLTGCTFRYIVAYLDDPETKKMDRSETLFDWVTSFDDLDRIKKRGISGLTYARVFLEQKTIAKTVATCLAWKATVSDDSKTETRANSETPVATVTLTPLTLPEST